MQVAAPRQLGHRGVEDWLVHAFAVIAQKLWPLSDAGWLWLSALGFIPAWLLAVSGMFCAYRADRTAPLEERTDTRAFIISAVGIASGLPSVLPWLLPFFRDFVD